MKVKGPESLLTYLKTEKPDLFMKYYGEYSNAYSIIKKDLGFLRNNSENR